MSGEWLDLERREDGVAVLRLQRPPMNTLNPEFLRLLDRQADALAAAQEIKALVIASGQKAFSAGMDLKELQDFSEADRKAVADGLNSVYAKLYGLPMPVVVAAHSHAIAGGFFFLLTGDYRILGDNALTGMTEVRVGVSFPIGPLELARAELSATALRRLMLSGRNIDAATALSLGVVDEIVPGDQVLARALEVAADYATIPPKTFASVKGQVRGELVQRLLTIAAEDGDPMASHWIGDETMEAARAILEEAKKRKEG